jgi:glutamyl-Q tRNA(Asp) synthetase
LSRAARDFDAARIPRAAAVPPAFAAARNATA